MISYWEKKHFLDYDTIIVGSGIVGLSCMAAILEKYPKKSVVILEKGLFPTGSGVKNSEFPNFGSLSDILESIKLHGEKETVTKIQQRWIGAQKLLKRMNKISETAESGPNYEIITNENMELLSKIDYVNNLLFPIFKDTVYTTNNEKIAEMGLDGRRVKALIRNKFEGQLDTETLLPALVTYVQKLGGQVLTGADVIDFRQKEKVVQVEIKVPLSLVKESYFFKCERLILATKSLKASDQSSLDTKLKQEGILVTKPISGLKLKGAFHYNHKGEKYFWKVFDERIMLGRVGGGTQGTKRKEVDVLQEVLLPIENLEFDEEVSNKILPRTNDKLPSIKFLESSVAQIVGEKTVGYALAAYFGGIAGEAMQTLAPHVINPRL